ncbi:MAG: 6-phosphofructokinase [Candidatus Glassbacteria bacterium]
MVIGVLTGGGDCPGLNAVIRGVVRKSIEHYNYDVLGIKNGWEGLIEGDVEPMSLYSVSGILHLGGTILGTSRTNPLAKREYLHRIKENINKYGLDAIIAIGGDDTLGAGFKLSETGINVIGVPKTIDNDIPGTDYTFGFHTAVAIATEAIDRLHTTAESHHRIMVIEVMGRSAGWIAVMSGIAGGADNILIPEFPFTMEDVCEKIRKRHARGKNFSIVVVAEGAKPVGVEELVTQDDEVDEFGNVRLGGIAHLIGKKIRETTGMDTRVTILGYVQRGGSPTPYDRILATRFGVKAAELAHQGNFGKMVALRGTKIMPIDLNEAIGEPKRVPKELYEIASVFFG